MNDDARSDAELLAAAAREDGRAFAVLVRRYIRPATLLVAQLLGDCDDVEDVVQDAFTVVYRSARTFDSARSFTPWFYAIVRRLASNRRTRELRRARLLRFWRDEFVPAHVSRPEDVLLAGLDAEAAIRTLQDLSPMQRACFELVMVRGLSTEEVATMHGISESTVRQHVYRARSVLRSALESRPNKEK